MEYLHGSFSCSGKGIVGMFITTIHAPKDRHEQRELTEKINSATGLKLSVNAGKRSKTRTGKPKDTDNSKNPEVKQT